MQLFNAVGLKGALWSFWGRHFTFLFLNKLSKQTVFSFHDWINWTNKLTSKNNSIYTVQLCLYVADPAIFLASHSLLTGLFTQLCQT